MGLSPYLGSAYRAFIPHVLRSCASSLCTSLSFMSFHITSLNLRFGRLCFGLLIFQCAPIYIFRVLITTSFSPYVLTFLVSRISSFFMPSTTLYTCKYNLCFWQTFLGQKYGYRPFPPIINANQFEAIQQSLRNDGKEVSLLHTWFKKDENVLPPVYNLVPVSSILVHYGDKVGVMRANPGHNHNSKNPNGQNSTRQNPTG